MNQNLQNIAKNYFQNRTDKNFNTYYQNYKDIARAAASSILRDRDLALEVVNDLFVKIYRRNDEDFLFNDDKSHVGYIWHSASNLAKIKWNKNRIKSNNLNECERYMDNPEFDYLINVLINEVDNIKIGLGYSRKDNINVAPSIKFFNDMLSRCSIEDECDECGNDHLSTIDTFMDDIGCTVNTNERIRKTLKIKPSEKLTYENLTKYITLSIAQLERINEINTIIGNSVDGDFPERKMIDDIKKIKSKQTRKKIDKVFFENTKVNMIVCESDFNDENETGDTLEYLGHLNGGVCDISDEVGGESDAIFGAGHMIYSTNARLDAARDIIRGIDGNENSNLIERVLVNNLEFKQIIDDISHVLKIGDKDINGYTKDDLLYCKDLALSVGSIPNIAKEINSIDINSLNTQDEFKECLNKFKNIISENVQLKCVKEEFGFNSVGAIKSKSHRTRKFLKEEHDRRMVISEITENKLHTYTGKAVDKFDHSDIVKMECTFKRGILHGTFKEFYEDGSKKIVKLYKDGKLDGDFIEYHKNGKIKITGQYSKGIKIGSWAAYREDGSKDELYAIGLDGSKLYELYDTNGNVQESGVIRR